MHRLDSFPGPAVFRALLLEVREYVLDAVGGPERQQGEDALADPLLVQGALRPGPRLLRGYGVDPPREEGCGLDA